MVIIPAASEIPSSMPCNVFHIPVTPEALGADSTGLGHILGPADAPVTLVLFSDYQCPVCAYLAASVKQIQLKHPKDVRLVYLNTWLHERDKDALAFQAAETADLQGKFWEMHDVLFEKLDEWSSFSQRQFKGWLIQQASGLGMDVTRFQTDFEGETVAQRLQQSAQSDQSQSVKPPTIFVNGTTPYLVDFVSLETTVSMEALAAHQFSTCPPWMVDPLQQIIATLHTAKGDVVIQLYPDKAPLAVNNFVFLARNGWYDGTTFYRVLPNSIIKAGDPSGTGMGNPGYLFETEIAAGLSFSQAGMVAMENNGPDSNGSRFFITLTPDPSRGSHETIFGQVISGLDVLKALTSRDPQAGIYLPPGDELISVTIEQR
jgi:cyclophilin family peptidyl-prolyl cis-trans isomerase/protein-disulfide isomerase